MVEGMFAAVERPDYFKRPSTITIALELNRVEMSSRQSKIAALIAQVKDTTLSLELRLKAGLTISALEYARRTHVMERYEEPEPMKIAAKAGKLRPKLSPRPAPPIKKPRNPQGPQPNNSTDAKAAGWDRYFTGRPCRHGHIAERYTSCDTCVECLRVKKAKKVSQRVAA